MGTHVTRLRPGRRAAVDTAVPAAPADSRTPPLPVSALHLTVLWSLAVAQPLFDVLGAAPEFFVARGSERADILLFAFGLALVPPALMAAVEGGLRVLRPTLARAWHSVLTALLVAMLAVQVLKRWDALPTAAVLLGALAAGLVAAGLYAAQPAARTFLTVLAPAPAVFLVLFLGGPVGPLVWANTSAAAPSRPVSARSPVVFVVLDELPVASLMAPDGGINAGRFPSFARLARESTWFRNTSTAHEGTGMAVPTILTGRLPVDGVLPVAREHPDNLFTLLGGSYEVDATETLTRLCPPTLCRRAPEPLSERLRSLASDAELIYLHVFLPERVAARLPHVTDTWVDFRSEGAAAAGQAERRARTMEDLAELSLSSDPETRFRSFVARQRSVRRPTLRYLHVLLPHVPFRFLPTGERYEQPPEDALGDKPWGGTPAPPRLAHQRHLLQLGFTDRLLGRLLTRLRAEGVYDEVALVVVADHGASFRPRQTRRHATAATLTDIAYVPFFFKAPHQRRGRVIDRHVRTVDVLPTLADALGIDVPWRLDGRSALRSAPPQAIVRVGAGEGVTAPNRALLERRAAAVQAQTLRFGDGGFDARFYALGAHPGLAGRSVRALARRNGALSAEVRVAERGAWAAGRLEGPGARAGLEIAVAVDGRIQGTTTTYRSDEGIVFALMLPSPDGQRDLRAYRVHASPLALEELGPG